MFNPTWQISVLCVCVGVCVYFNCLMFGLTYFINVFFFQFVILKYVSKIKYVHHQHHIVSKKMKVTSGGRHWVPFIESLVWLGRGFEPFRLRGGHSTTGPLRWSNICSLFWEMVKNNFSQPPTMLLYIYIKH